MRKYLIAIFLFTIISGCGGSDEPVIPENPTEKPVGGPSREGLPSRDGIEQ